MSLEEVVDATDGCAYTIWGFGVGPALTALVRAGRAAGVEERVAPVLVAGRDPTDHLIPVEVLLELPTVDVAPALDRFRAAVLDAPRVHRPDLERWSTTIWVDCMHTDGPGLALLGEVDAAVEVAEEAAASLQRDDGLFDHGYDVATGEGNGVAWGRGQGWALLGLVGTLRHAHDPRLAERLDRLVAALAATEIDGRWRTVVDDHAAPVEMSTSAYVAYGVAEGIDAGLVDPSYAPMVSRALDAAVAATVDGVLPTSSATPIGRAEDYYDRPLGQHPWGQGPLLLSLLNSSVRNG